MSAYLKMSNAKMISPEGGEGEREGEREREREREREIDSSLCKKNTDLFENSLYKCVRGVARGRVGRSFFENNGNLSLQLTTGIVKKAFVA